METTSTVVVPNGSANGHDRAPDITAAPPKRSETEFYDAPQTPAEESITDANFRKTLERSLPSTFSATSNMTAPPPGSVLTGKQEHYLKRELISQQTNWEVQELSHPTALQRFGAPFRSDAGEVAPEDSELPLLRYIFVHHVRNFPFLNKAQEKEFWQDKLQVFLESFANKHISSADDRQEQTKRQKLASKATKLVELMMVSGVPTASGYEERIRFSEMEVVDRGANEQGLVVNQPEGQEINGWDVNVAGVRVVNIKRHVRYHQHAEFLLRVKPRNQPAYYIGRRFGDFSRMHKSTRLEFPGKVFPPLPRKNKSHSLYGGGDDDDDDADSVSSRSTRGLASSAPQEDGEQDNTGGGFRAYLSSWTGGASTPSSHNRNTSRSSLNVPGQPRASSDAGSLKSLELARSASAQQPTVLYREEQRVSLRAFLRSFLQNEKIAQSKALNDFLTRDHIELTDEELIDIERRKDMDSKRLEEQRQFFEIARQRAQELDVHMEKFRRKVIEKNGLRSLFNEVRIKEKIEDLDPEYKKVAEWLRIEVAATLYHLFLAEDNSPELFAQAKRIHGLVPYMAMKQVIRFTNPAAVMKGVLDLFMAQPLGTKSLMQRMFLFAVGDGIRALQRSIDVMIGKIDAPVFSEKIKAFVEADYPVKTQVRKDAQAEQVDIIVKVLQTDLLQPTLSDEETARAFNAYAAWNNAVENTDESMRHGAELFGQLKQLLKLYTRKRDKEMMLSMIEEPTTLQLFRDLFTIFYEPLVRVYKSANVYNSVTDFARFADDAIQTIEKAQRQDISADPNQTVQSFIDLCARHEADLYKFVHEVHTHDDGLFDKLMFWIEGILDFLRNGPKGGKLDMNALFQGAVEMKVIDKDVAMREVNALVKWQVARKRWHQDKTRQKMATGGGDSNGMSGLSNTFSPGDFGLDASDLQDLDIGDEDDMMSDSEDEDEDLDPIVAERRRRARQGDVLKRSHGEPPKPKVEECGKMMPQFVAMLRTVLAS